MRVSSQAELYMHGQLSNSTIAVYFLFKTIPCLVAGMCIYLGYRLLVLGVTGRASFSFGSKEVSGQLLNATPGLFFAVGGIVALIVAIWKGASLDLGRRPEKQRCKRRRAGPAPVRAPARVSLGK